MRKIWGQFQKNSFPHHSPLTKSIIPTQHPMLEFTHTLSSIYNDFFCTHHYLTIFIVYNIHSCYEACRGMSILMHILVSYFSLQSQGLRGKKFKSLFIRCFSTTMMRKQNPILKGINCWKILWSSQIRVNFDFLICQKVL